MLRQELDVSEKECLAYCKNVHKLAKIKRGLVLLCSIILWILKVTPLPKKYHQLWSLNNVGPARTKFFLVEKVTKYFLVFVLKLAR